VTWRTAARADARGAVEAARSASLSPMLGILDGSVLPADQIQIPATDEGLLRGDGVFEVMRLYDGRPFAVDDHIERMTRSAANLMLPFDGGAIRADIETLLEAARPEGDGVVRVLVTRGGRRIGFLEPFPVLPDTLALKTITYSPTRLLDGVKSLSYGANMLATRLAEADGADEALLVTPHGRVLEAPTSSFFCSLDGRTLVTPPLEDHILDSITRRRLLLVCDIAERPIAADDLADVQEAFLASTVREVLPVHAIDGRELPSVGGALTRDADERVCAQIAQELGAAAR
jgi:branched-chain amino acid aminotransferase